LPSAQRDPAEVGALLPFLMLVLILVFRPAG
jgi:hypothetical protein